MVRRDIFSLILILVLTTSGWGQSHYQPVAPTGLPYIVVVNAIQLEAAVVDTNAEIGVFDGALCVGAAMVAASGSTQITTWQAIGGTQNLPGFQPDNAMAFRLWLDGEEIVCAADFEVGDGTFGDGPYSVVSLTEQTTALAGENAIPEQVGLKIRSASPFNGSVLLAVSLPIGETGELTIYNLLGQPVAGFLVHESGVIRWNARLQDGIDAPSGIYLATLHVGDWRTTQRMVLAR